MAKQTTEPKTVYVLTTEYNDYDQHGEYFVKVFSSLPSIEVLAPIMEEEGMIRSESVGNAIAMLEHLRKGGGQISTEGQWWNLEKVDVTEGVKP